MKNNTETVFTLLLGEENQNQPNTLKNTIEKIKKCHEDSGNIILEDASQINQYTIIYLVAHGDNPLYNKEVKFGNKSAATVADIISNLIDSSKNFELFEGKIILEGCHTAEWGVDENSREKIKEINGDSSELLKLENYSIGEESFLMKVQKLLKNNRKIGPATEIGGYLGFAHEGDYSISHYGIAITENVITKKYQGSRGVEGEKNSDGSIKYGEEESYHQGRINQNLAYDFNNNKASSWQTRTLKSRSESSKSISIS